jgi:N-acetylneuraminic acid mutarotase
MMAWGGSTSTFGTTRVLSPRASLARRGVLAVACLIAISGCAGQGTNAGGGLRLATPRMSAAVGSVGTRIYVIGGVTGNGYVSNVDECDPSTGSCSQKAPLPDRAGGASAAEVGGMLYVTGGRDGQRVFDRLLVYTPSADGWTSKRPMPTARWNHMSAAIGDRVYVFGGVVGTGAARRVHGDMAVYYSERDEWEHLGAMPEPVQSAAVAVVNGKIYLIGGRTETYATVTASSAASTAVQEFDPETKGWRPRQPMPTARTGAAAAVRDGKVFVVGGASAGQAVAIVEIYDPATDTWTTGTRLRTARTGHGVASVQGRLFVIAGASRSESDLVREIEELPR